MNLSQPLRKGGGGLSGTSLGSGSGVVAGSVAVFSTDSLILAFSFSSSISVSDFQLQLSSFSMLH